MNTTGVLVSIWYSAEARELSLHQSGILVRNYVITAANKIFIPDNAQNTIIKKIVITSKDSENNIIEQKATIETILHSEEVEETLNNAFTLLDMFKDKVSNPSHWSHFVLLKTQTSELLSDVLDSLKLEKLSNLEKGQEVIVSYTPFGSAILLNSLSRGIISNIFGKRCELFLIDARLAPSSEGSAVYRDCSCRNVLIGMVVFSIPFSESGAVSQCGFSLCVNLLTIFQTFRKYVTNLKCDLLEVKLIKNGDSSLRTSSYLESNYIVSISVGAGHGTGAIIASDGLIMTCGHVVNFVQNMEVKVKHQNIIYDAIVLYSSTEDSRIDIAFVLILSRKTFPTCYLTSRPPKKGELVYSIGQGVILNTFVPFVSKGIISHYQGEAFFISSCLVLKGSSGGVIVRPNGEIIGIITCMLNVDSVSYPFLSYSFPVCHILEFIEAFKNSRDTKILEIMNEDLMMLQWKRPKL